MDAVQLLLHSFSRARVIHRSRWARPTALRVRHGPCMPDLRRLIALRGGLIATHELYAAGMTRQTLAQTVRARRLFRVRQGWYAAPGTDATLLAAARVGGRATCTTGLTRQGIWVARPGGLHVACAAHDARLRTPRDSRVRLRASEAVRVHWRGLPEAGSRLILPPLECLRDALQCLDGEALTESADSLLNTFPAIRPAWAGFCAAAPRRVRAALTAADGICESGIETRTWLRIRDLPVRIRRQVEIDGVGRVDFLLGERFVVEVDGAAYHSDAEQFESDRSRDALLAARGMHVSRFSYRQVVDRWPDVAAAIAGRLARGDHLIPR